MSTLDRDTIFLLHASQECSRAVAALNEVDRLANVSYERKPGFITRENSSVFVQIRLALQYLAGASRVFWPPRNADAARGSRLREIAALPDDHGLNNRALRNDIEHIDERLDNWTDTSPRPFLALEWVIHEDWPEEAKQQIRDAAVVVYDAASHHVFLFGESYDLHALRSAAEDASALIQSAIQARSSLVESGGHGP